MSREFVQIKFQVHPETKKKFLELVERKHRYHYGNISEEGEEALLAWIRAHAQAQIGEPIRANPEYPHVHDYMVDIMRYLKEKLECLHQCSEADLIVAIGAVRGSDERTVLKWKKVLLKEVKLKILGPNMYEIV